MWSTGATGLVSVNEGGYLIYDIAAAANPVRPAIETGLWFFYYFATERGRRGLAAYRRDMGRLIWTQLSPAWHFDHATRGGHLLERQVFPTREVVVTETPAELRKVMRPDIGIALIDLDQSQA